MTSVDKVVTYIGTDTARVTVSTLNPWGVLVIAPVATVAMTSPAADARFTTSQTVVVQAAATDNLETAGVEFLLDGVLFSKDTTAPYTASWPITALKNGMHTWSARTYDGTGKHYITPDVTVRVEIPLPPTATVTPTPMLMVEAGQVLIYPQPARGKVYFAYRVESAARLEIDVYQLTGERATIIRENIPAGLGGTCKSTWETAGVAPGIYLCRIVIKDAQGRVIMQTTKKAALL